MNSQPHAFPWNEPDNDTMYSMGMTLRDYFAAAALTGLVTSNRMDCVNGTQDAYNYANDAYCIADAMLYKRGESK